MSNILDIISPKLKHQIKNINWGNIQELSNKDEFIIDYDVFLSKYNHNLQRDFCWTLFQKQQLIFSILKGIYIPPISLVRHSSIEQIKTFQIIDGKQRLSSAINFYNNEFYLTIENQNYYFNDLPLDCQKIIATYYFNFNTMLSYEYENKTDNNVVDDDEKFNWYQLLNYAGTPQDLIHLDNIKKNNNK